MAFDRSALGWKNLFVMQNGKRVSMGIDRLRDDQIHAALGRADNAGALASGWTRNAQGVVSRAPVAAPTPVPVPQAPNPQPTATAPVQRPIGAPPVPKPDAGPWRDANGNVPAPIKDPDTVRVYTKLPNGKWVIKTVNTSTLTLQQLNQALRSPLNKGALKAANPTNPAMGGTPAAPAPPAVDPNTGYFFNPWSDTLWSRRNADGTVELNAARPAQGSTMLSDMGHAGVNQYRIEGSGVGNIAAGSNLYDASMFLDEGNAALSLLNDLEGGKTSLAKLNAGGPGSRLEDVYRRDFMNGWDDQLNGAMGDLAASGMYRSGSKLNTRAKAEEAKQQGLLSISQQYGDLARNDINQQMEILRRTFGRNRIADMAANALGKQQQAIQNAIQNPVVPKKKPAAAKPAAAKPAAAKPAAPKPDAKPVAAKTFTDAAGNIRQIGTGKIIKKAGK